ncbi:MAG: hypothetical protein WCS01_12590 [bacterium]
MKITKAVCGMAVLVSAVALVAHGQSYSPIANLTEKWSESNAAWVKSGDGSMVYDGSTLAVKFVSMSPNAPLFAESASLRATDISSGGRFVGNYLASQINLVSFDVNRTGLASDAYLRFMGANNKIWQHKFSLPAGSSQWVHVEVPFGPLAGWQGSGGTFEDAAQAVVKIWVSVDRSGIAAQELAIDNFKVVGPWGGPMTNGVPQSWMQEYGLGDDQDPDHDGFKNYGEYLAGTDPTDKSSFFTVAISKGGDGTPALKWGRGNAKQFGVWRSSDLTAGFTKVQTGLTTNEVSVAGSDADSYFYLVEIEQ